MDVTTLPRPARYFPIEKGTYEVGPGMRSFGLDLGNGAHDQVVFQFDRDFSRYRSNKIACREERLTKYLATASYAGNVSTAVNRFLCQRLAKEHPELFRLSPQGEGWKLDATLTGESFDLNERFELAGTRASNLGASAYVSAFDALCSQVQEDIAVMSTHPDGSTGLAAIHLCSPSHWSAEDKIGKSFIDIHAPVPGIEKVNAASRALMDACIQKGPYVRFVWGFATDRRLNHHPEPAPSADPQIWKGRSFDRAAEPSPFILRVERQVLWGLPEVQACVFTIRVSFVDGAEIKRNPLERAQLRSGLLSMTPASRGYKGVADCLDELVAWLDSP